MARARYLLLSLLVLVLDQLTKAWLKAALPLYADRPLVPGLLSLRHGRNPGMAFGLLSRGELPQQTLILSALSLLALFVLAYYALRLPLRPRLPLIALALVLGGAVGNLLDRLRFGFVTDFVHVYWGRWSWPDFNLADSAISVGVTLLVLGSFKSPPPAA